MAVSQISHERVQTQDRLQKIAVRITSESNRFASGPELTWQRRKGSSIGLIVLNPNRKYQEILGFGAALTDAACSLLAKLAPEERRRFLRETFDASGMALKHLPRLDRRKRLRHRTPSATATRDRTRN